MSEGASREWRFYVDDMIAFAEKVLGYTAGLDQTAFVDDPLVFDATVRNLELIGEAATRVPGDVRLAYPEVPWRMLVATRNRLIHGYLGIDNDTLWSIVASKRTAQSPAVSMRTCTQSPAATGTIGPSAPDSTRSPARKGSPRATIVRASRYAARSGLGTVQLARRRARVVQALARVAAGAHQHEAVARQVVELAAPAIRPAQQRLRHQPALGATPCAARQARLDARAIAVEQRLAGLASQHRVELPRQAAS